MDKGKLNTKKLILAGIFLVIIVLMTSLLRVPVYQTTDSGTSPVIRNNGDPAGSYLNLGDAPIYAAALVLGGPLGALVAAIGSCLADIFVGSSVYAIPSFIIKGCMALLAARLLKKGSGWMELIKVCLYCSLIMIAGYFLFDLVIMGDYGVASFALPLDLLQTVVNTILAVPVLKVLSGKLYKEKDNDFIVRVK